MTTVVLTGFMGTGKTTVGRLLADSCGMPFVDLDAEIERRAGRPIEEIFAEDGEVAFRHLESQALEEVLARNDTIVATGGGALLSPANRALLDDRHRVVCLVAEPEELRRRLNGAADRPVLQAAGSIDALLEERAPVYSLFPQIDSTGRGPAEVARAVIDATGVSVAGSLHMERTFHTDVVVDAGATARLGALLESHGLCGDILVVADATVVDLGHVDTALKFLKGTGYRATVVSVPSGEEHKTVETLSHLYGDCLRAGLDRSGIVLGIGGGVVCDLAGMVAATYLRGIRYVALPTTLLAQVDAAIGGKVGVDLDGVKNLVGAFYPAHLVVADPELLGTLSRPLLADGAAEIIKVALVRSARLLQMVEEIEHVDELPSRMDVIRGAALEKIEVVRRDPFEGGERMMLNFGHTVGHALETASEYRVSHGQAVSIGMVAETRLAVEKGLCNRVILERLLTLLERFGLPRSASHVDDRLAGVSRDAVLQLMRHDKKRSGSSLRFALPTGPGSGEIVSLDEPDIRRAIEFAFVGDL